MVDWSRLPPEEIERRRRISIDAMKRRDREDFDRWYQEECDRTYWSRGQCCGGCDHWRSDMGGSGECSAAGIVSGFEVLRSMGVSWSSYVPAPGFPRTEMEAHCGKFADTFDWSTLDREYLIRIGAIRYGQLRPKPSTTATVQ